MYSVTVQSVCLPSSPTECPHSQSLCLPLVQRPYSPSFYLPRLQNARTVCHSTFLLYIVHTVYLSTFFLYSVSVKSVYLPLVECPYSLLSYISVVQCSHSLYLVLCSGELRTQKWKSYLLRTQGLKVLVLKPGVFQYIIAIHATLTARDFSFTNFCRSGPFTCIFLINTDSCVGPQNKIGHPAYRYKQVMQVPMLSARGI